jgi:hypothetical protein
MMTRVSVPLDKAELSALVCMAEKDCRHPREQLRFLLREAAKLRKMLDTDQERPDQGKEMTPCQS